MLCVFSPASSIAASFDCARARTILEILICGDLDLSALDEQVARTYSDARSVLSQGSDESLNLLSLQRNFLKGRTEVCKIPMKPELSESESTQIITCLKGYYTLRLNALEKQRNDLDAAAKVNATAEAAPGKVPPDSPGVRRDSSEAGTQWRKAADQEDAGAQYTGADQQSSEAKEYGGAVSSKSTAVAVSEQVQQKLADPAATDVGFPSLERQPDVKADADTARNVPEAQSPSDSPRLASQASTSDTPDYKIVDSIIMMGLIICGALPCFDRTWSRKRYLKTYTVHVVCWLGVVGFLAAGNVSIPALDAVFFWGMIGSLALSRLGLLLPVLGGLLGGMFLSHLHNTEKRNKSQFLAAYRNGEIPLEAVPEKWRADALREYRKR
jgi:uncharacterized protein